MEKIWASPLDNCNHCGKRFGDGKGESSIMADAAARHGSRRMWGYFCDDCITDSDLDIHFGLGKGQRYELQTRGDTRAWFKVEG